LGTDYKGIGIHRAGVASWALVYPIDLVSGEHGSILTLHATKKLIKSSTPSQVKAKVRRNVGTCIRKTRRIVWEFALSGSGKGLVDF